VVAQQSLIDCLVGLADADQNDDGALNTEEYLSMVTAAAACLLPMNVVLGQFAQASCLCRDFDLLPNLNETAPTCICSANPAASIVAVPGRFYVSEYFNQVCNLLDVFLAETTCPPSAATVVPPTLAPSGTPRAPTTGAPSAVPTVRNVEAAIGNANEEGGGSNGSEYAIPIFLGIVIPLLAMAGVLGGRHILQIRRREKMVDASSDHDNHKTTDRDIPPLAPGFRGDDDDKQPHPADVTDTTVEEEDEGDSDEENGIFLEGPVYKGAADLLDSSCEFQSSRDPASPVRKKKKKSSTAQSAKRVRAEYKKQLERASTTGLAAIPERNLTVI